MLTQRTKMEIPDKIISYEELWKGSGNILSVHIRAEGIKSRKRLKRNNLFLRRFFSNKTIRKLRHEHVLGLKSSGYTLHFLTSPNLDILFIQFYNNPLHSARMVFQPSNL
jgi:hypothetical protein